MIWAALVLLPHAILLGQNTFSIRGLIKDEQDQALPYANIGLYRQADSSLISGTISDAEGAFRISHSSDGQCYLTVSFVGYESQVKDLEGQTRESMDLGIIHLMKEKIELAEARVTAERIKARKEGDRTTFFVNSHMAKASATTMDLIQCIPGIQVDLFRHISLEGKSNILILVNGKERSAEFLGQLDPRTIDKVEIIDSPGSEFRSDVSGVIHVILKENDRGISGHIYSDIPLKMNEVYAFPSAGVNLSLKKMHLFASYDGEFNYFDIEGINRKGFTASTQESHLDITGSTRQEYWSHKIHAGLDYQINKYNQFSVYGFVNPWSQEFNGAISLLETQGDSILDSREGKQDDSNRSRMAYGTVYLKHLFRRPGSHLSLDLNYLKNTGHAERLFTELNGTSRLNTSMPQHEALSARLDLRLPLGENMVFQAGARGMSQKMSDQEWTSFEYRELISAAYSSVTFAAEKIKLSAGLRVEHSLVNMENRHSTIALLPHVSASIDFREHKNLQLSYRKTIERPTISQLNPNVNGVDPFTSYQGNPGLNPAMHHKFALDYSLLVKNNYLSLGAFFTQSADCMEYLATVSEYRHISYTMQNLGTASRLGLKFLASTKPLQGVSFNPFVKVYGMYSQGNELAAEHGIENLKGVALESGFSLSILFKHDISLNAQFKYNSPTPQFQGSRFEDMLYMVSLQKQFKNGIEIGMTSALPLGREFTFQGHETRGAGFTEYAEDNIQLSLIPVWIKFKYSFSSGKKTGSLQHHGDFSEQTKREGLLQ